MQLSNTLTSLTLGTTLIIGSYVAKAGDCWKVLNTSTQHISQLSSEEVIDFAWNNGSLTRCSDTFWREGVQYRNCGGKLTNHDATNIVDQTGQFWPAKWQTDQNSCSCTKVSTTDYKQICTQIIAGYVDGQNIPIREIITTTKVFRSIKPEF